MPRVVRSSKLECLAEEGRGVRLCEVEGCAAPGLHRAPSSRERLRDYRWFCLDHVRAYNQSWDYYRDMGPEAIEAELRRDAVWRRPTWRFAGGGPRFDDPFELFGETPFGERGRARPRRAESEEEKALAVLGLAPGVAGPEIKQRYKTLVKALHPDANGGDRGAEERLKAVTRAYAVLKRLASVTAAVRPDPAEAAAVKT